MLALITEDSVLPPTFNLMILLFKDEGDLAKHPLSFHLQSGVWQVRKYEKGIESEGKLPRREKLPALAPILLIKLTHLLHELN